MQKAIISALFILVFIFSCKLVDDGSGDGITYPSETSLVLDSPVGGESVVAGTSFTIEWTSTVTEGIYIAFTYDNGNNWFLIADSIANTGTFDWFPVPDQISDQCKITVATISNSYSDVSDTTFSIIKNTNEALAITSPNGGETIQGGSQYPIRWFSSEIDSVKLQYTIDNGLHWSTIAVDTFNTGIFYWDPVPDTSTTLAKIRIMDASDELPADQTDSTFTILPQPSIRVISPDGGEVLYTGGTERIFWTAEGVRNVKIDYTVNGGADWTQIVTNLPNNGFYDWINIPASNSILCKVRVYDADDLSLYDSSDDYFLITTSSSGGQVLKLTSPVDGDEVEAGTSLTITWFSDQVNSVGLEYTINNGNTWNPIATVTDNNGIYYWDPVPNTPSSLSKIRIFDSTDGLPTDTTVGFFSILPEPVIEVLNPNGGETWTVGSSQRIEWSSENIRAVKIDYTTDNGGDWYSIVASTPSIGFFTWDTIPTINSQQCKIRIYDADDGQPSDVSDETFTVTDPVEEESITVVSPNGGEDFEAGTLQNITWLSNGIDLVKIELSTNNGLSWNILEASIESTGGYQWQIDETLNAPQSRIRISDVDDGVPTDASDASFIISPIKSLDVTYPTNGLVFTAGTPITVLWESSGIEKVGIRYTYSNGIAHPPDIPDFVVMETSIANQGSYETSFSIPSEEYYVEVYDAEEDGPRSRSVGNFKITPQIFPTITLTIPNGGEEWLTSDPMNTYMYEIIWESNDVDSVKLEYTLNGGADWITIVEGMESSGIYNWQMPENVDFRSENAKVRVSSVHDESFYDECDNVFAIHPQTKLLRMVYPNAGETISPPKEVDDPVPTMSWHSAGIFLVDVELSLDNGVTWIMLANDTQSTGVRAFDFSYPSSTNARIKVTDASADAGANPISDMTDVVFSYNLVD